MKPLDIPGRRRRVKVDQETLAKAIGIHYRTLSDIENGFVDITEEYYALILTRIGELSPAPQDEEALVATAA